MATSIIKASDYMIQSGSGTTDSDGSLIVYFSPQFAEPPNMVVTADGWNPVAVSLAGLGRSVVTIRTTANKIVYWIAHGKR